MMGKQLKNIAKHILIFAQCHLTYTHPGSQHDPRNHFAAEIDCTAARSCFVVGIILAGHINSDGEPS